MRSERSQRNGKLIQYLFLAAFQRGQLVYANHKGTDGSVVRDYIYIEDVCEMIGSLINYDGNEEVFNVSSNQGISLNDVISKMKEYGLAPDVVYKDARSVDVAKVVLDNHKIESIHECKIRSFEEGLKLYIDYLKNTSF